MNYIVLDLEWNQCPTGKSGEIRRLPFEIIEIGAVKLDENLQYVDSFREIVQPVVYRTLHFKTQEIVALRQIDLQKARNFLKSSQTFLAGAETTQASVPGVLPI